MPVQTITSMGELQKLANTTRLTVVDCFATWCGPCKAISPYVEELSKKYSSTNFAKVDVDDSKDVAEKLGVRAMPTFVFFKNGKEIDRMEGADRNGLEERVKQHGAASFEGQGHRLGDANHPSSSSAAAQQSHEPLRADPVINKAWPLEVPENETAGKVLLQLPDGTRNPLKVCPTLHKVSDVFKAISQMMEIPVHGFALAVRDGMKTHELNKDDQTTLKDAKVAGGVLLLRRL